MIRTSLSGGYLLVWWGLNQASGTGAQELGLPKSSSSEERREVPAVQDPGSSAAPPAASVFPIPAIEDAKNEGITYGLLAAILIPDDQGEIDRILALDLGYRKAVGLNGFVDYRHYLSPSANLEVYSCWARNVENENQISYDDRWFDDAFDLQAEFDERRVATERYFGKGSHTPKSGESAYASNNYLWQLCFGPDLSETVALQGTFRARRFREGRSLVDRVPQMRDLYPGEFGIQGGLVTAEGIRLSYEHRDDLNTPTRGEYGNVFAEAAQYTSHGRTLSFQVFGFEAGKLWPLGEEARFVTVAHVQARFTSGQVPFWELPSLGGSTTLRSFGMNRFTENNFWVLNLEERIRCFDLRVEEITSEVQLAPFFDVGEVSRAPQDIVRPGMDHRLHYSVGMGFRAVIHPYVVGRADVAYGREGVGVTVGLDYPF